MSFKPVKGKSVINTEGRVICIGDPHGCYEECMEMLDILKVTSKDTVIFSGDIVDRGPETGKCIELAMQNEAVIGNHEDKLLRYRKQEKNGEILTNLPEHHIRSREQLNEKHYLYLEQLPHYIRLPQYNSVIVHAGVFPGLTIEQQDADHMIRIQYINPNKSTKAYWSIKRPVITEGEEIRVDDSYKFWIDWWDGPERIIFGHSVLNKPLLTDKFVGIDGGCCFGDELWALVLPDNEIVRIKSKQPKKDTLPLHLIYEDIGTY